MGPSDLDPVGIIVLSGSTLRSLNARARTLLADAPDADLDVCRTATQLLLEDRGDGDESRSTWVADISHPEAPRISARRLHVTAEPASGDMRILQVRTASTVQEAGERRTAADHARAAHPIRRAFAHDARNPVIAGQLQTGILRELDAVDLAERAPAIAQTLDRHLSTASDGIAILVDELAPDPDDPPTDVLSVIDYVRRLTLPYARKQSATVEARTGTPDLQTRAPVVPLRRLLVGFLARLLPHAESGNRIDIRATEEGNGQPIITLVAHGLLPTATISRDAVDALMFDATRCDVEAEMLPHEDSTCVRLHLPLAHTGAPAEAM